MDKKPSEAAAASGPNGTSMAGIKGNDSNNKYGDVAGKKSLMSVPSPELSSNIFQIITLSWISKIVFLGYKRPLELNDIWEIHPNDDQSKYFHQFYQSLFGFSDLNSENMINPSSSTAPKLPQNTTNGVSLDNTDTAAIPANQNVFSEPEGSKKQKNRMIESNSTPSTFYTLIPLIRLRLLKSAFLFAIYTGLRFVGPILLGELVKWVERAQTSPAKYESLVWQGYLLALGLGASQVIATICSVQADFIAMRVGLRIRNILTKAVFHHTMESGHQQTVTEGQVINLVSTDAQSTALEVMRSFNQIWSAPFTLAAGVAYIYVLLGPSIFAGLAIMAAFVPISMRISKLQAKIQRLQMQQVDFRMKLETEAMQGIKILKLNAWEGAMLQELEAARQKELKALQKLEYYRAATQPVGIAIPNIASVVTFMVFVALGGDIQPATAFSVVSAFVVIRTPFMTLPIAMSTYARAKVALMRFDTFFSIPSKKDNISRKLVSNNNKNNSDDNDGSNKILIEISNDSKFSWGEGEVDLGSRKGNQKKPTKATQATKSEQEKKNEAPTIVLKNVGIKVKEGELLAVVGRVASGKSSLCSALIGEIHQVEGSITYSKEMKIAYCVQEPFIMNTTLRENILFGKPMDKPRYDAIIEACALQSDLLLLPGGDLTEIGERGTTLSGGQKARVSFARAVYADADVYILDSILSAVDAHVGKHLFERCISNGPKSLLRNKTRILVTNNLQVLSPHSEAAVVSNGSEEKDNEAISSGVDRICVLKDGEINELGTYDELMAKEGGMLQNLMKEYVTEVKVEATNTPTPTIEVEGKKMSMMLKVGDKALAPSSKALEIAAAGHGMMSRQHSEPMVNKGNDTSTTTKSNEENPASTTTSPPSQLNLLARPSIATAVAMNNMIPINEEGDGDDEEDEKENAEGEKDKEKDESKEKDGNDTEKVGSTTHPNENGTKQESKESSTTGAQVVSAQQTDKIASEKGKFIVAEYKAVGKVKSRAYVQYWLSGVDGSYVLLVILLSLFALTEASFLAIDGFLAVYSQRDVTGLTQTQVAETTNMFLLGYGLLTLAFFLLILIRSFSFATFSVKAAGALHKALVRQVIRFPMAFFWETPMGRVINRLSADTNQIDTLLPQSWQWFIMCFARVIGILIVIAVSSPIFIATLIPLGLIYFLIYEFYRRTSREVQRIESITRSPLFNQLSETCKGLTTIRAFGRKESWLMEADEKIRTNHRAKFIVEATQVWLTENLEFLGSLVISLCGICIVAYRQSIGPGIAGFALAYSLNIVVNMQFTVKSATQVESLMSGVERVLEYADHEIEHELEPKDDESSTIDVKWPSKGKVEFEDVVMSYRAGLDPALRGLSFVIEAGESCGVVGRTGAGKSSIMVTLFRLVDPSFGKIIIDGVDIKSISKHSLRSRVTLLPQDPVLFNNTLRFNVDPFNQFTDAEIWQRIEQAGLKKNIEALPLKLQAPVAVHGENFSVGERQLICLVRALLRKSRIMLLDEASAYIDTETEEHVQEALRKEQGNTTMIVIAHRLQTCIEYDKILVMGAGRKIEFGSPYDLLCNDQSVFSSLVRDTGKQNAAKLKDIAAEVAKEKAKKKMNVEVEAVV